ASHVQWVRRRKIPEGLIARRRRESQHLTELDGFRLPARFPHLIAEYRHRTLRGYEHFRERLDLILGRARARLNEKALFRPDLALELRRLQREARITDINRTARCGGRGFKSAPGTDGNRGPVFDLP